MFLFAKRKNSTPLTNSPPLRNIFDRKHERFDCNTPIIFENYETKELSRGSMVNYSEGGLYLEAEHCPKVGNGALVHIVNYSPNAAGPDGVRKYHVQVRWVKQETEAKAPTRYAIGVKRCDDIYELFRLFGH